MTKPGPYHHGSLENAILDLAVVEIEKVGYEMLSLRELATAVGVSRGAPYRHFPNRLYFLEAVIVRSLRLLVAELVQAAEQHDDAVSKVRAVFEQFLDFAHAHPQLYRLTFASDIFAKTEADEEFSVEAEYRFSFFIQFIALLVPDLDPKEVELRAVACWSYLHGFAVLSITKRAFYALRGWERHGEARRLVVEQCLQLPGLAV